MVNVKFHYILANSDHLLIDLEFMLYLFILLRIESFFKFQYYYNKI